MCAYIRLVNGHGYISYNTSHRLIICGKGILEIRHYTNLEYSIVKHLSTCRSYFIQLKLISGESWVVLHAQQKFGISLLAWEI